MKSVSERVKEFVDYHINGDGECNNVVLREYSEINGLTLQERYVLAFLFSVTYCVTSSIVLFTNVQYCNDETFLKNVKENIIFQSDRKYMRMKDNFVRCMKYFFSLNNNVFAFMESVCVNGIMDISKAIKLVSGWVMFGRFSAYLFLETFAALTGQKVTKASIEWKKGDTATSGLLNVFGFDDEANLFDQRGVLVRDKKSMDKMFSILVKEICNAGGDPNVTVVETSLCAYRKFYKGTRYNGFYLDRMLGEINDTVVLYPNISKQLFEIRRNKFDDRFLGEISGWNGIRRDMNHYYKERGFINDLYR